MTANRRTVDVGALPGHAFGHRGLIWWGTIGFMVIEGSMFVMAIVAYFYLRLRVSAWPPSLDNPDIGPGTANLVLAVAGCVPAALAKRAAEKFDLPKVRLWLTMLTLVGFANVALRVLEYPALNCRWDDNAYGSVTWLLLSMHTAHIATDAVDSAVLMALMFSNSVTAPRLVDVSENSLYWYFIVIWWVPIYLTIYFAPRWM
jgi:cytochrome c oxidase subunit III